MLIPHLDADVVASTVHDDCMARARQARAHAVDLRCRATFLRETSGVLVDTSRDAVDPR